MTDFEILLDQLRRQREDLISDLVDVDLALRRVAEGRYGLCEKCGQAIDSERLASFPTTGWCRICKHDFERRRGLLVSREVEPQPLAHAVGDS